MKNKPKMNPIYRQGDVLIVRVESIPDGAKPSVKGNPILAHGEVTGHHHQVQSKTALLLNSADAIYLDLRERAELTHQEHATIDLPAGNYRIVRQREYHPEAIRQVAD